MACAKTWGVIAVGIALSGACGDRSLGPPFVPPPHGVVDGGHTAANRKIDILFMVDNSASMGPSQANLRANFAHFMDVLKNLPGGMPDLHLAVVSSDMGVGHGDIPGCNAAGGDRGVFHHGVGAGAGCSATGLAPGATYISSTGGANPQTNFTGDITDVFTCIAPIGETGCGFENQLRSITRALGADGETPPVENQGFLRPDAYLGIVMVSNEDDCSAATSGFYDVVTHTTMASRLGPPGNFRCAEFGYLCNGARPDRNAPNGLVTDTVSYESCVSAESGELVPVSSFVRMIRSLKPDPSQILVASIQGVSAGLEVHWKRPALTPDPPWPEIAHACTGGDGSFADPGIRLQTFVGAFGGNGLVFPICADNFGPALSTIAQTMAQPLTH
jgi:hypothetical protein